MFEKRRSNSARLSTKLIFREGRDHGWPEMTKEDMALCADWFDQHLMTK